MSENDIIEKSHSAEQLLDEVQKSDLVEDHGVVAALHLVAATVHGAGSKLAWEMSQGSADLVKFLLVKLLASSAGDRSMVEKILQLDKRTRTHSWRLAKMEADIGRLTERGREIESGGEINGGQEWPSYASKDMETIVDRTRQIEEASGDSSQVLYCMMELETLLDSVAKKARATGRKYEGRLAASLRDVCRIYEPDEISEEQAKRLAVCVRTLIEGWGVLTREKVHLIRSKLLEVGLTWLPVTGKAQKEIEEAKRLTSSADGE